MISEKVKAYIANADSKLNVKAGWDENELQRRVKNLFDFKRIECGWRQSCGTTDRTHFTHREWVKVIKKLRAEGLIISEEAQKHGNAYATSKGGFWQSIIYTSLHKRIYAALVRKASLLSAEILKNKISLIAVMEGANPKDYQFSSLLDALSLKITPDEFEEFLAEF